MPEEPAEPLRQVMNRLGVNMNWYDKTAGATSRSKTIPLYDTDCNRLSLYLLKKSGQLWTIEHDGTPYAQVRSTNRKAPKDSFICAHCKGQFKTLGAAVEHTNTNKG